MPEKEYQRLTRDQSRSQFAISFVSRSSLWLGKDHLLCVDTSGYTETYKRFYFRDIQAVIIRATGRRAVWNWIWGVPAIIFLLSLFGSLPYAGAAGPDSNLGEIVFFAFLTSIFAVALLINNLLGRACVCQLRTAVQIEDLPSLNRLRRARKVLGRIRPLITAAQGGQLSPENISHRMRTETQTSPAAAPAEGAADNPNAPPVIT